MTGALALAGCGSEQSGQTTITAFASGPTGTPQNLRVDRIRDGEVWLEWDKPDRGSVQVYVVYRSTAANDPAALDTTYVPNFQDAGLDYETEYSYFVTAISSSGHESERSQLVSGQPFNNLSPLAPSGVRAVAHNISIFAQLEILLDWQSNTESDLVGYRVYRSREPVFESDFPHLLGATKEARFVDQDIDVGVVYFYRVTAFDRGNKESAPSDAIADVALLEPELIEPAEGELTSSTPVFRWHPVPNAETYRVVVTTSPTSGEVSAMVVTDLTSAPFSGRVESSGSRSLLLSGAIYYWKVIASTRMDGSENSVSSVQQFKIR